MVYLKKCLIIVICTPVLSLLAQEKCVFDDFMSTYSFEEKYQLMVDLALHSDEFPMENKSFIKSDLEVRFNTYLDQSLNHLLVIDILRALPPQSITPLYTQLISLAEEYQAGVGSVNSIITTANLHEREILLSELQIKLAQKYSPLFNETVDQTSELTNSEKDHLKKWAFEYVVIDPEYKWGDSASKLLSYMSDLRYFFFKQPAGRLTYGPYSLDHIYAQEKPALNLNIDIRPKKDQLKNKAIKPMNIKVVYSIFEPLGKNISVEICDFSLGDNPNTCDFIRYEDWCQI